MQSKWDMFEMNTKSEFPSKSQEKSCPRALWKIAMRSTGRISGMGGRGGVTEEFLTVVCDEDCANNMIMHQMKCLMWFLLILAGQEH